MWSPRKGLRVSVVITGEKLDLDDLLQVGRGIRALRESEWQLLLRQTTWRAQVGRFEPGMTRVKAAKGSIGGDPWKLYVLIPPDYPLSRDDLRGACMRLDFRGRRRRSCSDTWERVAGHVFIFGEVAPSWRRLEVHFYRNVEGVRNGRSHAVEGYPRNRFYALPLPTETCDLYFDDPDDPEAYGPVLRPEPGTRDYERCGF